MLQLNGLLSKPIDEMGLCVRNLVDFNKVFMVKLAWEFLSGKKIWAQLARAHFYKNNVLSKQAGGSSILKGVRLGLVCIAMDVCWLVGGSKCSIWHDNWVDGGSLASLTHITEALKYTEKLMLSNF